jgi:hypothetical protein
VVDGNHGHPAVQFLQGQLHDLFGLGIDVRGAVGMAPEPGL